MKLIYCYFIWLCLMKKNDAEDFRNSPFQKSNHDSIFFQHSLCSFLTFMENNYKKLQNLINIKIETILNKVIPLNKLLSCKMLFLSLKMIFWKLFSNFKTFLNWRFKTGPHFLQSHINKYFYFQYGSVLLFWCFPYSLLMFCKNIFNFILLLACLFNNIIKSSNFANRNIFTKIKWKVLLFSEDQ